MKNFKLIKLLALFVVLITSINTAWATARTFKSGEKIYFKDTWKANGNSSTWKVDNSGTGTLCAYFYGDGDGWYKCYGSDNKYGDWNAANTIYEITVPGTGKNFTHVVFTRGTNDPYNSNKWSGCWNKTMPQAPDETYNIFYVGNSTTWDDNENKYNGTWGRYAHNAALVGEFNNWDPDTYPLSNSGVKGVLVPLEANTTYNFKILLGETYYGINSASTITSTLTTWWRFYSGQGNVPIKTNVAGDYGFAWNASTKDVTVYYPDALYPKSTYIYLDVSNESYWNENPFTARFYLKYFDTSTDIPSMPLECSSPIEDNVYYVQVPDNGYIGHVQLNRYYNSGVDGVSNVAHVYSYSAVGDNCLKEETGKTNYKDSWTPQWKTYCPPMSSASMSDNSTTKISWQTGNGTSGDPYLVPRTGTIKVSASATKAVPDDNMTMNYDFKVNTGSGASSAQASTSTTFNKSGLVNNTTYEISLDAYNTYNGATGTKHTTATHIWYKALDVYTVSHSLTNMTTASGRTGSEAAAYGIAYTATFNPATGYNRPASVTVMRGSTNITANCTWNQSTGELTIPAEQVSGNITITVAGVAQQYNITYRDKDNAEFTGTQAGAPTTHTYGSPTDLIMPTREHYEFAGWFTASNCASGQIGNTTAAQIGATAFTGDITLYAKWTEITHTVSFDNDGHGTTTPNTNQTVGEVTGVAINASNSTGYSFNTWTITSGSGSFASSASTASNTFKPTSDATLTASFNAITYNGVIDSNGGTSDGAYSVTFNDNKIDVTTPPTYAGYEVEEYHFTDDLNMKIANKDESLVSNFSHDAVTYISGGKWVKDGAIRLYPKWGPITYTIALDDNFPEGTTTTPGSVNFTAKYGTSNYSAITYPTANGYKFVGYFTNDITPIQVIKENHSKNTETARDYIDEDGHWVNTSTTITLYAHWTPVALSFTNEGGDGSWTNTANWSPACVPTSSHNVTINAETKITGSAVADTVTIAEGGKVIIEETGVLEVGSTVINTNSDKLVINTTTSSQGALIFDITKTSPSATVNMSIPSDGFHLIASPTGGAKVSSTFAGSGIYTYAWEEGKGWDRRGYYDDFSGNEAILIFGQTSCSFSGILSKACGGSARYSTGEGVETSAQGVNMIANPLTAPIKIAAMTISGSKDGAVHLYDGSWVGKTPALAGDAVIPAMQGYGVIATSGGGSVSFTYNTAVRGASSKNAPLNAPKRTDSDILDHITLSVTTNDRKVDLNLYENEQFTERIDVGWEAIYMEGDGRFGELYAIADEKMNILATPDLEGTVLGFVPGQAASYTISFEGDGKGYYLNDLDMQESTLIEEGNTYVFTPNESTNATRFVISKMPIHKTTTGNDAIYDGVKARKQMIDGILYIIRDGRIYDATGVLVK